jgi:exonuclease SbcC
MGKTLFEGDIGSGKSSILMAIEFAFFGLGSETGGSLLKVGEAEGSVRLAFDVDGKEYEITRGLFRKGSKVQQTEGHFRAPDEELDLSPTELKEKILETLEFNEAPDPKAQSRVYRYAVYTPQEGMKSILGMAPEDRLQILRRAFGIEDYRTAIANSAALAREVRTEIRELKSAAEEVVDLRTRAEAEKEDLRKMKERTEALAEEDGSVSGQLTLLKEERNRLREDEVRLAAISRDAASQERAIGRLREELKEVREEMRRAEARVRKAEAKALEPRPRPGLKRVSELEEEALALEERSKSLAILKDRIDQKVEEYRSIAKEGICPVCDRPAHSHEFAEKEKVKAAEKAHLAEEATECETRLAQVRRTLKESREFDSAAERAALQKEALVEVRRGLAQTEKNAKGLISELSEAEEALEGTKMELAALAGSSERLKHLEESADELDGELKRVREESAKTRARAEEKEKLLVEYESRLKLAESAAEKAHKLGERRLWLEDYFAPTVGTIERQVMTSINQEFDSNFKRWFSILVGDPQKEARVDDSFTPIVSQDGYEQESDYLSGGERTSVALAYRLALNTLVQGVSMGMRSNILILDEPTDGFSKEQLGSVREVLDDVGCPQMIIVSHEKELESFVDQIFRVTKVHGESRAERASA